MAEGDPVTATTTNNAHDQRSNMELSLPVTKSPTNTQSGQTSLSNDMLRMKTENPPSDPSMMSPPLTENVSPATGDLSPGPKHQAAFVNKLYSMVEDPKIRDVMWTDSGLGFLVTSPVEFSKCLHNFFKHNNWQSFVRQLNMYQFHKVNDVFQSNAAGSVTPGAPGATAWEFKHPCFQRGRMDLLSNIKRKASRPVPQSRESYNDERHNHGREQPGFSIPQHPRQEYLTGCEQPALEPVVQVEPLPSAIGSRFHGVEETQRMLMDQTSDVFAALRTYHGILSGIANVLAVAVPDQNTAAIQSDLNLLSRQLTQAQYAPRRTQQRSEQHQPQQPYAYATQQQQQQQHRVQDGQQQQQCVQEGQQQQYHMRHSRPMHINMPTGPRSPYQQSLVTPSLNTPSGWSNPGTPAPFTGQSPTYSPRSRPAAANASDGDYFRQSVTKPQFPPVNAQQQHQFQQSINTSSGPQGKSPTWPGGQPYTVLTPPLSDSSRAGQMAQESNTSSRGAPQNPGTHHVAKRPVLEDRCRSLQSLLNSDSDGEDRKRRKGE